MISCIFHSGSGLGNQLHRYVAVRCLALDKGYDFGVINPQNFKGRDFMHPDMGGNKRFDFLQSATRFEEEKVVNDDGVDVRPYDEKFKDIQDNTIIDGEFQDERHFEHHLDEVREWLKVEPLDMPDDLCIINFRGGEYVGVPDLFLSHDYWILAQEKMLEINPNMRFQVHTDDVETAKRYFAGTSISDIALNWRSIRYAKYLILSNSSFAILPALLNENAKKIIAPKNWARRNIGVQSMKQNVYKKFDHI